MTKSFQVSTEISAPVERIWSVLTDAANYTRWNTSVEKLTGEIRPGNTIKVYAKISPGQAFPVKVVEFVPNQQMVWQGGMPLGLFKGRRTFTLTPQGSQGVVLFSMEEVFSGLMAPLITKSIPNLQPAFDEFAACLKRECERTA